MPHLFRRSALLSLALAALCLQSVEAQSRSGESTRRGSATENRVTLTRRVEPSFHIEPIVHRFKARRGAKIPFQFEIRSTGKEMNVAVRPVTLRQELSGIILHDVSGPEPTEVAIDSAREFRLTPGSSQIISGEVTVPLAKSNFLSYGILVRDNGIVSEEQSESDPQAVKAAVRFVTQYVLRIDIETGVKDMSQMNQLVFEDGGVVNEQGLPIARTVLVNRTSFAFECGVRGTVNAESTARAQPFRMTLPSRASIPNDERYLVRIMPKSRVIVRAPVDGLLFPGSQAVKFEVTNGRRALVEQSFDVDVASGDYPALDVKLAFVDDSVSVEPAQVEVGRIADTKRSTTLKFSNNSQVNKSIDLSVTDLSGQEIDTVRLSSKDIVVKAGRTKTVRLSIPSSQKLENSVYGRIHLSVRSGDGEPTLRSLPLAMWFGSRPMPQVSVGELELVEIAGKQSFRIRVTNQGDGFAPIHGELLVAQGPGRVAALADGFGRWINPGQSRELIFLPSRELAEGDYQLKLTLTTIPDAAPIERTLNVSLKPSDEPGMARAGTKDAAQSR